MNLPPGALNCSQENRLRAGQLGGMRLKLN